MWDFSKFFFPKLTIIQFPWKRGSCSSLPPYLDENWILTLQSEDGKTKHKRETNWAQNENHWKKVFSHHFWIFLKLSTLHMNITTFSVRMRHFGAANNYEKDREATQTLIYWEMQLHAYALVDFFPCLFQIHICSFSSFFHSRQMIICSVHSPSLLRLLIVELWVLLPIKNTLAYVLVHLSALL